MSTSLLYHAFGLAGYKYVRTSYVGGRVEFHLIQDSGKLRCSACGSREVVWRGFSKRCFRTVPIGNKQVRFILSVQRVGCRACGKVRQVKIGFADERRTYTKSFERYALELSRYMTIRDVSVHLGIGWDVIKDIQKRHLRRKYGRPGLSKLKRIAVDEISVGRGQRYLTVVMDLVSGAAVFVGKGKGADALIPFWKRLKRSRARIEAVAMDMGPAYIAAVRKHLPTVAIVFDHFHVIKLFNEKLADLRRDLYREVKDQLQKDVLKGSRWLLLKNPENLNTERNERERLHEALKLNEPLAMAYYLKEDLRQLWSQSDKATAAAFLENWIGRATASGVRILMRFAVTLAAHRTGILAYYDYRISTGPLEGFNNKIKTMQRQAYGFRDEEFFILKIYALHETKYALTG